MAIGFTPKYEEQINLEDISKEDFLIIAIETCKKLEWSINYISNNGLIAYTKFSMSSWSEEITVKISDDIADIKSECTGNQFIDWGKNKKNIEKFISTFNEQKISLAKEEIALKYEELKQHFVSNEQDILVQAPKTSVENVKDFFSLFIPTKDFLVTPILIDLNILMFIIMILSGVHFFEPTSESLIKWGANFKPLTLGGEWWRIITCCFVHIGIIHLFMNMYALLYIGVLLEPLVGKDRFAVAYLLTGVCSSIASLWWHDFNVSAGASGAIFGMYGVFLALLLTDIIDKAARQALLTSILFFVGYNLMYGLNGGVDNAAHIGGLVSGFIIGFAYLPSIKKPQEKKLNLGITGLLIAIVVFSSFSVLKKLPNGIVKYEKIIKDFTERENIALNIFNTKNDSLEKKQMLDTIMINGIANWNYNAILIDSLDKLKLPEVLKKRNANLRKYCELRLNSYFLIYNNVKDDTNLNNEKIEDYNKQIKTITDELRK